ncbi:MAG: hypothetical protein ACR2LX_09995 [Jatrophihabitans sp.]
MIGVAAGAALGAGVMTAVAAIPSANGTITGCYVSGSTSLKTLYLIDKDKGQSCPHGFTQLTWNQQGQPGAPGPAGPSGPSGPAGPPGPGAVSFDKTTGTSFSGLLSNTPNSLIVVGDCYADFVDVRIVAPDGTSPIQASGTGSGNSVFPVNVNGLAVAKASSTSDPVDLNVIARPGSSGTFDRIDVHGELGVNGCTFWGTVTPAT